MRNTVSLAGGVGGKVLTSSGFSGNSQWPRGPRQGLVHYSTPLIIPHSVYPVVVFSSAGPLSSRIKDSSEGYSFNVVINQLGLLRQMKIHSPVTMPPPPPPVGPCITGIVLSREQLLNLT